MPASEHSFPNMLEWIPQKLKYINVMPCRGSMQEITNGGFCKFFKITQFWTGLFRYVQICLDRRQEAPGANQEPGPSRMLRRESIPSVAKAARLLEVARVALGIIFSPHVILCRIVQICSDIIRICSDIGRIRKTNKYQPQNMWFLCRLQNTHSPICLSGSRWD